MSRHNEASQATNDLLFAALTQSGLAPATCTQPVILPSPQPLTLSQTGPLTNGKVLTVKLPATVKVIQANNATRKLVNGNGTVTLAQKPKPAEISTNGNGYSKLTVAGRKIILPSHLKNCVIKKVTVKPLTNNAPVSTVCKTPNAGCKRTFAAIQNKNIITTVQSTDTSRSLGKDFVEHAWNAKNEDIIPKKSVKLDLNQLLHPPSNGITKIATPRIVHSTLNGITAPVIPDVHLFSALKSQSTSGSPIMPANSPIEDVDDLTLLCESPILLPKVPLSVGLDQEENDIKSIFTSSNSSVNGKSSEDVAGNFGVLTKSSAYDPTDEDLNEETDVAVKTFSDYRPNKLKFGKPHPDSVVETSALSSIPPPDITYNLTLPDSIIDHGLLTCLQLEAVIYACQKHLVYLPSGERAGYLIGDGPGVGKGRTIAGIIYENYLQGRKRSLWFSVSNDLKIDAERDLRDIGADIPVYALNKMKYGKLSSKCNGEVKRGVLFVTYSCLISESHDKQKYGSRMKQIINWCGKEFAGPVVFDECHKAKNLFPSGSSKPTKTGMAVMELQHCLPHARFVYASATGATEPRNMAYMSRIGLWGAGSPFTSYNHFIQSLEKGGVGAMELVAMHLKLSGSYIVRQLSFYGVSFSIDEVKLDEEFSSMYNKSVRLWVLAKEAFEIASELFGAENSMLKTMWTQFWAAHQRFFKYMCVAAKVKRAAEIAKKAVRHGKCVVIGLQSTGEARTLELIDRCGGKPTEFVSTTRGVFENLIEQHFPAPDRARVTNLFGKDFYPEKSKSKPHHELNNGKKDEYDSTLHSESEDSFHSDDDYGSNDEDISKIFGSDSDAEGDSFCDIDSQEIPRKIEEQPTVNSIMPSLPTKPLCTGRPEGPSGIISLMCCEMMTVLMRVYKACNFCILASVYVGSCVLNVHTLFIVGVS